MDTLVFTEETKHLWTRTPKPSRLIQRKPKRHKSHRKLKQAAYLAGWATAAVITGVAGGNPWR